MQNASLSTLTKSSHKRQQNSPKSNISSFFLRCWCKYVEHSSTNPLKTYAKKGKKKFGLKVQNIRIFLANSYVSLHKFLWTREMQFPRHWRDTFAKSPQTLHSGSKNAAKSYNLFWKKRFIKKSSRHAECKVVIPDESSSLSWRRKKLLAKVKKTSPTIPKN